MKGNRPPFPGGKPGPDLNGRKVLLGVCGGIAAYKAVELTRLFIKNGARVQVVMTDAAAKFVAPLTFETITGRHVFIEMFPAHGEFSPWHTELASWPDVAVIAPATANHMARLAAGIADDLLSTIMLTLERPRMICPSMNHRMWANPATQDNVATLKRRGFRFVMPEEGQMARPGEEDGLGRLAEPDSIYREVFHMLSAPQDLRGVRVLVTAGRTEESWDPVRVLTNRATGRMGFALAEEAQERGADVMLIHGPTDVIPPSGVRIRRVTTAAEMAHAVRQEFPASKIVLMAAAVADYTFARTVEHKIKKGDPSSEMQLVATEDILKSISDRKGDRIIVGFALETENLLENALKKLREKHLDIVVANNPLAHGSGFAGDTNQVLIIHRSGRVSDLPLQSKREAARDILNSVLEIYRNPEPEPEIEIVEPVDEGDVDLLDDEFDGPVPTPAMDRGISEPRPPREHEYGRHDKKPQHGKHERPERPQPGPRPQPLEAVPPPVKPPVSAPQPRPAMAAPAPKPVMPAPRSEPVPPVAAESGSAELPFPGAQPQPAKKSRSRRGGRRSARARARLAAERAAAEGLGSDSGMTPPPIATHAPEPQAPKPPLVKPPVVAAPPPPPPKVAPTPSKSKAAAAPKEKAARPPRPPRGERKPKSAPVVEAAAPKIETPPPKPVVTEAPVVKPAAKRPRAAAAKKKPAAKKSSKPIAAEAPEHGD